jgi:hypothetical protein
VRACHRVGLLAKSLLGTSASQWRAKSISTIRTQPHDPHRCGGDDALHLAKCRLRRHTRRSHGAERMEAYGATAADGWRFDAGVTRSYLCLPVTGSACDPSRFAAQQMMTSDRR